LGGVVQFDKGKTLRFNNRVIFWYIGLVFLSTFGHGMISGFSFLSLFSGGGGSNKAIQSLVSCVLS
jgi:hypothetical protein